MWEFSGKCGVSCYYYFNFQRAAGYGVRSSGSIVRHLKVDLGKLLKHSVP